MGSLIRDICQNPPTRQNWPHILHKSQNLQISWQLAGPFHLRSTNEIWNEFTGDSLSTSWAVQQESNSTAFDSYVGSKRDLWNVLLTPTILISVTQIFLYTPLEKCTGWQDVTYSFSREDLFKFLWTIKITTKVSPGILSSSLPRGSSAASTSVSISLLNKSLGLSSILDCLKLVSNIPASEFVSYCSSQANRVALLWFQNNSSANYG